MIRVRLFQFLTRLEHTNETMFFGICDSLIAFFFFNSTDFVLE